MTTFEIYQGNITDLEVDVYVNAANPGLHRGSGVCGAIFAASEQGTPPYKGLLEEACARITHGCHTGDAVATPGFGCKATYVVHAVGPIWRGGEWGEDLLLKSAYLNALKVADHLPEVSSIAFPSISAGVYGYPHREASFIAIDTCFEFVDSNPDAFDKIVFACFDDNTRQLYEETLATMTKQYDL